MSAFSSLHSQIVDLPCDVPPHLGIEHSTNATYHAYKSGHRAARMAAAELASKASAEIEQLRTQKALLLESLQEVLAAWIDEANQNNNMQEDSKRTLNSARAAIAKALG